MTTDCQDKLFSKSVPTWLAYTTTILLDQCLPFDIICVPSVQYLLMNHGQCHNVTNNIFAPRESMYCGNEVHSWREKLLTFLLIDLANDTLDDTKRS